LTAIGVLATALIGLGSSLAVLAKVRDERGKLAAESRKLTAESDKLGAEQQDVESQASRRITETALLLLDRLPARVADLEAEREQLVARLAEQEAQLKALLQQVNGQQAQLDRQAEQMGQQAMQLAALEAEREELYKGIELLIRQINNLDACPDWVPARKAKGH